MANDPKRNKHPDTLLKRPTTVHVIVEEYRNRTRRGSHRVSRSFTVERVAVLEVYEACVEACQQIFFE